MLVTQLRHVGHSDVVTIDADTQAAANIGRGDIIKVSAPERHKIIIELVAFARELKGTNVEGVKNEE